MNNQRCNYRLLPQLIMLFIYISNNVPFLVTLSQTPHPILALPTPLCLYECAPPPIHPLLPHLSSIPLYWSIKPPQNQGPSLPLMSDKTILCYMCMWRYGFLHVYSLVGGLVLGSSAWYSLFIFFFLWGCIPFSSLSPSFQLFHTVPDLRPIGGSEYLHLSRLAVGRASPRNGIFLKEEIQ